MKTGSAQGPDKWGAGANAAREWLDLATDDDLQVVGIERLAETAAAIMGVSDAYPFQKAATITRFRRVLRAAARVGAAEARAGRTTVGGQ